MMQCLDAPHNSAARLPERCLHLHTHASLQQQRGAGTSEAGDVARVECFLLASTSSLYTVQPSATQVFLSIAIVMGDSRFVVDAILQAALDTQKRRDRLKARQTILRDFRQRCKLVKMGMRSEANGDLLADIIFAHRHKRPLGEQDMPTRPNEFNNVVHKLYGASDLLTGGCYSRRLAPSRYTHGPITGCYSVRILTGSQPGTSANHRFPRLGLR